MASGATPPLRVWRKSGGLICKLNKTLRAPLVRKNIRKDSHSTLMPANGISSKPTPSEGKILNPTLLPRHPLLSLLLPRLLPSPPNTLLKHPLPPLAKQFSIDKFFYRERHCPESQDEKLRCLIPVPVGYRTPFAWPKSRDYAWFRNVPFPKLTVYKKTQNWVRLEGKDRLFFPGGGTSFPLGAKGYVDLIKRVVPFKSGTVRTVLDVGCG
ncbi:hypothetical protein CRG98_005387, partial [Punica granatum]